MSRPPTPAGRRYPMCRVLLGVVFISFALPGSARAQGVDLVPGCRIVPDPPGLQMAPVADPARPGASRLFASGNVVIQCDRFQITADEVEYFTDTATVHLRGHVQLDQTGMRIYAERADLDRRTQRATFYNVHGTAQTTAAKPQKDLFGGMEPDVTFWADEFSKTGEDRFEVKHGGFTSCVQATPRWSLTGTSGTFVRDSHITFWNAVLKVKDVPVFYGPFIYYPINKEDRSTGFLMPSFGSSSVRGFTVSSAFFWAIDRSQDATLFHDYMKKAGSGYGAQYRFVSSPGSSGDLRVYTLGQRAQGAAGSNAAVAVRRTYDVSGRLYQALPHGFQFSGHANYFTDVTTQQLYQQNVLDLSRGQRTISATLTGNRGRYRLSADAARADVFTGAATAQRGGYAPRLALSMAEAPIGRSPVYFGASGESAYIVNQGNIADASTNRSLWRFDATPTVRWPMSTLSFLSVTTVASWRVTEWLESLDPATLEQRSRPLARQLFNLHTRIVGPVFARVWQPARSGYADRVKHLVEPNLTVQWYSPFSRRAEVVQLDGVDSIVGGTATYTYGLTNRILIRPRSASGSAAVREMLSLDVLQSYYTNSQAAAVDPQYASAASSTFSPVQITLATRPVDALTAQFRMDIDPDFRVPRTLGASAGLTRRTLQWSAGWTKRQYIPGLPGFNDPALADHFLNTTTTYRTTDGRLGGAYSLSYDVRRQVLVQQRIVGSYNSQCCGVSVDYQVFDLSHLGRRNRTFNFAFTLAGLGSFANPLGSFGK
jgi:LPS-assembly protein